MDDLNCYDYFSNLVYGRFSNNTKSQGQDLSTALWRPAGVGERSGGIENIASIDTLDSTLG